MRCSICNNEVKVLNHRWGKSLCNYCLGANWPRILSEHNQEIKDFKDKLHRRNMQIKDLKIKMETLQSWCRVYIADKDILKRLEQYFIFIR